MAGQRPMDAYVCYDATDAVWVRVLVGRLFAANLVTFLDPLHPDDADVLAVRMAAGRNRTRSLILVIGPHTLAHGFVARQYEQSWSSAIAVVYGDTELPDFAAGANIVDFRNVDADGYDQRVHDLVHAIDTDSAQYAKPPPAPGAVCASALLRIDADRVTCTVRDTATGEATESSAAVTVDGHRLSTLLWGRARHESEALRAIGTALGATFTPDPVGRILEDVASDAYGRGTTLNVAIAAGGDLSDLPWETLILPGHNEPLALHPATRVYRAAMQTARVAATVPAPGPLRILAAMANLDDDSLVDYERELSGLIDVLEPAARHHGARVRILNEGNIAAVAEALSREAFQVLHLSCRARPGMLVLEDPDGHAEELTPRALCAAIPPDVRLVVLTGCWNAQSAPGHETLARMAQALLESGVDQVLTMTAAVTDRHASALYAAMYRELALTPRPDVLNALGHARRQVEGQRRSDVATGGRQSPAEWATAALYQRGTPGPLYDPTTASPSGAPTAAEAFVGRRADLRRLLEALRAPGSPGVVVRGIAGVGKSALAAEAVRRLGSAVSVVVSTSGVVTADEILASVGGHPALLDPTLPMGQRLDALTTVLRDTAVVLVMDRLEANLLRAMDGGWVLANAGLAAVLSRWASRPGRGRLILTSRQPFDLPDATRRLCDHHVGPVSWSEARALMWRLPALDALTLPEQQKSYVDSGGHPGTLELIDALLCRPGASLAELRARMERLLRDRKIDRPELWMAHVGKHGVDTALAEAVTSAVYPTLLADAIATSGGLSLLGNA